MRRLRFWHVSILGAFLLASAGGARYRLSDSPLFLHDMRAGRVEFEGQGKQFIFEADTLRQESAFGLRYGLTQRLVFEFSYPYLMESLGPLSKSGQGDLATALSYRHPLSNWPGMSLGLRQALIFPSGFRRELVGFDRFTGGRTQAETLVQLEFGDRPQDLSTLWLAVNGGLRTDNHLENTKMLWGASIRYHLVQRWLFLESELAQEMATDTKEATYQFSAGLGVKLPWGFQVRLGAEERVIYELDRFGLYAALGWSRQPVIPIRMRYRHLHPGLQKRLDDKNKVPSFTLEPGTPALLTESGRLPFLPLRVVLLPFVEADQAPVAVTLSQAFHRVIEADSSFQVVPPAEVEAYLDFHRMASRDLTEETAINELGRSLKADLVLRGRILSYQPRQFRGHALPPLFARSRQAGTLEAQAWLQQVDHPGPPHSAKLSWEESGPGRWSLFTAKHGLRERPGSALERSALTHQLLESWSILAANTLMYEETEVLVIDK
jgi:hypothetical protein